MLLRVCDILKNEEIRDSVVPGDLNSGTGKLLKNKLVGPYEKCVKKW